MPSTRNTTSHPLGAAAVLSLCVAGVGWAADWPQWGGDGGRNMVSAERGLPTAFELISDGTASPTRAPR